MQGMEARLRGHFGITPREARAKLTRIKHPNKVTLQQHADKVGQLVILGYAELEAPQQQRLAIEAFANSLDHP